MAKKKDKFLLVSLDEDKAKKLAQVISNPTCHKVLDFLTDKEATETEISTALNLPISTVHYNLQQLVDARLVEAEEFHYSSKGREVNHYRLANKYIIIAPKQATLSDTLKKFLPVGILGIGVAAFYGIYRVFFSGFSKASSSLDVGSVKEAAPMLATMAAEPVCILSCPIAWKWIVLAFIAGMIIALAVALLARKLRKK